MRYLNLSLLLVLTSLISSAQKLPDKQQTSVWAPDGLRIDGKAAEWDYTYRAHNHATNLFYTLANNNEFLYLVIHAEDGNVISTLVKYGFTFTVQPNGKKVDQKDIVAINFPTEIPSSDYKKMTMVVLRSGYKPDTSERVERAFMQGNNNTLQQRHKSIIVTSAAGSDTLSVYNEVNLKVAEAFDNKRTYTMEIAVPLSYFKFITSNGLTLSYHLAITGYKNSKMAARPVAEPKDGYTPEMLQGIAELNARLYARDASTDFWGEYTLAKAP